MKKLIVLYDSQCQLCVQTKRWFEKFDWFLQIRWTPLDHYDLTDQANIRSEDVRREIHVVEKNRNLYKGFSAVRKIMLVCPPTFFLAILLYFPYAKKIGDPLYQIIAKNRHKLLRKKCQSGNCLL